MILGLESILIGSSDGKTRCFYKNILKLKVSEEMEFGEDNSYGIGFDLGKGAGLL